MSRFNVLASKPESLPGAPRAQESGASERVRETPRICIYIYIYIYIYVYNMCIYIYIYIYIYIVYMCVYIYIYRERERKR